MQPVPVLELRQVTKRFGAVLANDRVDLQVARGSIHALVGENGAGKSTAMRIAYGFYAADAGEVRIDGVARTLASPHDAIRLGIGMVHQHFMLVDTMTVAENVMLGAEPGGRFALDRAGGEARIRVLAREFGLAVAPEATVERLSVGQQQRVELLKALYREARLFILDEPTAVLTPQEVDDFFLGLRRMREQGKTIVLITHKLGEVLAISDQVTVMRDGRVVGSVATHETGAVELARWIVGRDVLLRVAKRPANPGRVVLSVRGLTVRGRRGGRAGPGRRDRRGADGESGEPGLAGVSFEVRAGEIVGIAGVEGNGQVELLDALAGLVDPARVAGSIELDGVTLGAAGPRARKRLGVAYVPEDRQRRGLVLDFDLAENSVLGVQFRPPAVAREGGIWMQRAAMRRRALELAQTFGVRPPDPDLPARALSGGNQQKLVVGRELSLPPKLLLVAQPTRGVDIGAIELIHRELIVLRDAGCAVLLVSAELEEVTALADRLLVLRSGKIAGEVDPARARREEIGLLMTGGGA